MLSQHSIFRTVLVPGSHPHYRYSNSVLQVILRADAAEPVVSTRPGKPGRLGYGVLPWGLSIYLDETNIYVIQWTCHHALIDGWSTGILLRQVRQFYETGVVEVPAAQFANVCHHFATSGMDDSVEFWRNRFQGVTSTHLTYATSDDSPENEDPAPRALERRLNIKWDGLRTMATRYGAPISVFFHAAWALILSRYMA